MKIDTAFMPSTFDAAATVAREAEELGLDGLWSAETSHDPFFPLVVAARETERIQLGTGVAIVFPRSPMVLANICWDLQANSGGRFMLGLGTQVKGHNQRRFSVKWEAPVKRLREVVLSLRAIWDCWQNGTPLNFEGEFYQFSLMTPFFNPGPIEQPHIPIIISGLNPLISQLAGEVCDGFFVHNFHTPTYLKETVIPNIEKGLAKASRKRQDFTLEMLDEIAVIGTYDEIAMKLAHRYAGLLDRLILGLGASERQDKGRYRELVQEVRQQMQA